MDILLPPAAAGARRCIFQAHGRAGQLQVGNKVLAYYFAFATFPGVKLAVGQEPLRGVVLVELVVQGDAFEVKIVAVLGQVEVFLQQGEAAGVGLVQLFVKLVELHQHACIGGIEAECFLQRCQRFLLVVLFVVVGEGQVAMYSREGVVKLRGAFPAGNSFGILAVCIPVIAEVVRRFRVVGVGHHGGLQHVHVFYAVGEAEIRRRL